MEMTVCFPAERLPGQALRDIGIKAPRLIRDDKLGSITATNGAWTANLLTLRIHLSLIQYTAYDLIFSAQARKTSPENRIVGFRRVFADIEAFRRHFLFTGDPKNIRSSLFQSDFDHLVRLEADYFLTKHHLHSRAFAIQAGTVGSVAADPSELEVPKFVETCFLDAARLTTMVSLISSVGNALDWEILPSLVGALRIVFTKVAQKPLEINNLDDIMKSTTTSVQRLLRLSTVIEGHSLKIEQDTCKSLWLDAQRKADMRKSVS
ncbi:putative Transcription factor domain-containing protein [Seiridium cardinale]